MRISALSYIAFLTLCSLSTNGVPATNPTTSPTTAPTIVWQPWSDDIFKQATKENRLVILDLHAVWCHWCHVMDETTYRDPTVIKLIQEKYIAVGVDQDSRPDLSNRYEDYGWPATIIFDSKGNEIAKRRGYLPPARMASLLQAIIDDPTPGPSVQPETVVRSSDTAALTPAQRAAMIDRLAAVYDPQQGGWGTVHKFVDADVIEYCLSRPDANWHEMARKTLTGNLHLIDPAWGGVYQYSTDGDWVHPHFEKIMSYQADDIRAYSRAYAKLNDPQYLKAAEDIHRYLKNFLMSPRGAFYTSQDADLVAGEHGGEYFALSDSARRAKGIPRIDTNIYARENGWAIEALAGLFAVNHDAATLDEIIKATKWICGHRFQGSGLFQHGDHDVAGPYLGDSLAMARAFLAVYEVTADRAWLGRSQVVLSAIGEHFARSDGGFATTIVKAGDPLPSRPQMDENIAVARFANRLYAYTGEKADRQIAEAAMKYIAAPAASAGKGWAVGGILLADEELASEPVHIAIVGRKSDAAAQALYTEALRLPISYKRIDWVDSTEKPLPNSNVKYPELPQAAAFLCSNGACSAPVTDPPKLAAMVNKKH